VEDGVQLFQKIVYANNHVEAQVVGWSFIMCQWIKSKVKDITKGIVPK
jgi:hypothetical protein